MPPAAQQFFQGVPGCVKPRSLVFPFTSRQRLPLFIFSALNAAQILFPPLPSCILSKPRSSMTPASVVPEFCQQCPLLRGALTPGSSSSPQRLSGPPPACMADTRPTAGPSPGCTSISPSGVCWGSGHTTPEYVCGRPEYATPTSSLAYPGLVFPRNPDTGVVLKSFI